MSSAQSPSRGVIQRTRPPNVPCKELASSRMRIYSLVHSGKDADPSSWALPCYRSRRSRRMRARVNMRVWSLQFPIPILVLLLLSGAGCRQPMPSGDVTCNRTALDSASRGCGAPPSRVYRDGAPRSRAAPRGEGNRCAGPHPCRRERREDPPRVAPAARCPDAQPALRRWERRVWPSAPPRAITVRVDCEGARGSRSGSSTPRTP
jgi:hypothetical protein